MEATGPTAATTGKAAVAVATGVAAVVATEKEMVIFTKMN